MAKPFVSDKATGDRDQPVDYRKAQEGGPRSSGAPGSAPKATGGNLGPKSPYKNEPFKKGGS